MTLFKSHGRAIGKRRSRRLATSVTANTRMAREGGIDLVAFGERGPARSVRTQKCEIKYKKPTSAERELVGGNPPKLPAIAAERCRK